MISRSILIGITLLAIARPCPGLEIMLTGIVTESRVAPHIVGDPAEMRVRIIAMTPADFPPDDFTRFMADVTIEARTLGDAGIIVWAPRRTRRASLDIWDANALTVAYPGVVGDAIVVRPLGGLITSMQEYDRLGNSVGLPHTEDLSFCVEAVDWFAGGNIEDIPSYLDLPPAMFGIANMNRIWGYSAEIQPTHIQFIHDAITGDANRDGLFDRFDVVQVQQAGKYQSGVRATWAEGDWNADGYFDNRDLMAALAEPSPVAIPEASGLCLAIFAMLFLLRIRPWFDQRWPCNA